MILIRLAVVCRLNRSHIIQALFANILRTIKGNSCCRMHIDLVSLGRSERSLTSSMTYLLTRFITVVSCGSHSTISSSFFLLKMTMFPQNEHLVAFCAINLSWPRIVFLTTVFFSTIESVRNGGWQLATLFSNETSRKTRFYNRSIWTLFCLSLSLNSANLRMILQTFRVYLKFRRRSLLALSIHSLLAFVLNMRWTKWSGLVHFFVQIVNFSTTTFLISTNIFLTFNIQFLFIILTLISVFRKLGLAIATFFSSFVQLIYTICVALDKSCCRSLELIGIWCGEFVIKASLIKLILNSLPILVRSLNNCRCLIL